MAKTIIVSNRLPIRIEEVNDEYQYKTSEGGLATALGSIYKENGNIWIGWPGLEVQSEELREEITENLVENHMRPVFLSQQELDEYYLGFSNQTLWPAFHYFVHHIRFNKNLWQTYKSVNQKFADAIEYYADPDDIIWVHDYQLMLVPKMLRDKFPNASIGFFQHIPFPSFEIFRMLPWREELLEGLLGSDFVGLHTYDDMRHFLSSVHRLTNYSYTANKVKVDDRQIEVDALPMGIDYQKYYEVALSEETYARAKKFREDLGDQRFILSVDRLDYSKGIPDRLKAFGQFLEEYPEYQGQVSIILVVVPSRDKVPSYRQLKEEVDEVVGRINGNYSRPDWQPIHYFYRSFELNSLSAFYRLAEVAMITPVRDGMNLVCKEFVASKHDLKGVLILSEMAGSSKELSEAIMVNPHDEASLVQSLHRALNMPLEEQKKRISIMQESLQKYSIFNWVNLFYQNLKSVKVRQHRLKSQILHDKGLIEIAANIKKSRRAMLLLDYDGTLVPFFDDPNQSIPDKGLMNILEDIASRDNVEMVVISGRMGNFLEEHLGHLGVTLVAEHGIWIKEEGSDEWESNAELPDPQWKEEAKAIINFYVDRTPGSFIEEKKNALVWHYRKVERGLASLRCSELSSHLRHVMSEKGLDVMEGNAVVEIKPSNINKGKVARKLFNQFKPDYAVALGDDFTDEYIFEALEGQAVTIKVGDGQTHAQYSIEDHARVREFLMKI